MTPEPRLEPLTVKKNPVVNPLTCYWIRDLIASSVSGESFGIYKSNTTAVPIPIPTPFALEIFEQIPTPVTIPKSPSYKSIVFSSLTYVGGEIKTVGGLAEVYPIPDLLLQ